MLFSKKKKTLKFALEVVEVLEESMKARNVNGVGRQGKMRCKNLPSYGAWYLVNNEDIRKLWLGRLVVTVIPASILVQFSSTKLCIDIFFLNCLNVGRGL